MRRERLKRLRALRKLGAPKWIIKCEQMYATLERKGISTNTPSQEFTELYEKHVRPLMGRGEIYLMLPE